MRQIKFRGKRISDGVWLYGDLMHLEKDFKPLIKIIDWSTKDQEVDPDTVSQFTGLTDKNGKEIYEGDILLKGFRHYSIEYNKGSFWLINNNGLRVCRISDHENDSDIIGNIHDNLNKKTSKYENGFELISKERKEQIEKHGWSLDHDTSYADGQLVDAALFCYEQSRIKLGIVYSENRQWPDGWIKYFEEKIRNKSAIDQLTVCGAFFLAEYDRTYNKDFKDKAYEIATEIDDLVHNNPELLNEKQ